MCNVNITFDVRTHAGMYTHTCTSLHLHEFSTHVHIPFFQNMVVTLSVYLSAWLCVFTPVSLSLSVSRLLSRWYSRTRLQALHKTLERYLHTNKKCFCCVDWSTPTSSRALASSHATTMASCWCGVSCKGSRLICSTQSPTANCLWGKTTLPSLLACWRHLWAHWLIFTALWVPTRVFFIHIISSTNFWSVLEVM